MEYTFEDVDELPERYDKIILDNVPAVTISVVVVKLVKVTTHGAPAYILSDGIDRPTGTTFFLVTVEYRTGHAPNFWLVGEDNSTWPVRVIRPFRDNFPAVMGSNFWVSDCRTYMSSEEFGAVIKAIKQYVEGKQ